MDNKRCSESGCEVAPTLYCSCRYPDVYLCEVHAGTHQLNAEVQHEIGQMYRPLTELEKAEADKTIAVLDHEMTESLMRDPSQEDEEDQIAAGQNLTEDQRRILQELLNINRRAIDELRRSQDQGVDCVTPADVFDLTDCTQDSLLRQIDEYRAKIPNSLFESAAQAESVNDRIRLLIETKAKAQDPPQMEQLKSLLHLAGDQALEEGNFLAGKRAFSVSSEICRLRRNKTALAAELNMLAIATSGLGEYSAAISNYEEAAGLCREVAATQRLALVSRNHGSIQLYAKSNYDKAVELFNDSAKAFETLGRRGDQAGALNSKAKALLKKQDLSAALEMANTSMSIYLEQNYALGLVEVHCTLGRIFLAEENHSQAREHLEAGQKIADEFSLHYDLGKLLKYLATAYERTGEPERARETLELSQKLRAEFLL